MVKYMPHGVKIMVKWYNLVLVKQKSNLVWIKMSKKADSISFINSTKAPYSGTQCTDLLLLNVTRHHHHFSSRSWQICKLWAWIERTMSVIFHMAGQWKSHLSDGYMCGRNPRLQFHRKRSDGTRRNHVS